ncbi:hormogonium polysaccharide secretion pseudopilin HpsC [Nostoc sp. TCL26-01]|uniref:hormogonium polysaccharide secretion pseudopilin HpsC n=1 Tax=Nostoc sp. TCL26-01 TaxID=2576904 RepID=UPI0015BA25D2|nr:hormogonium polysaccharide secretion pseudopilin HpsC [Nostoc sp. TCL26-01]QLE57200.1 prepilin-type N-terminal cleavage/methylation domain-containing protein [Nostoc sp. TCL26-01]
MSPLKFILSLHLKHQRIKTTNSGFTLIELLVAIILAFLVITPLMLFMTGLLDSDRREQAKVTTEQELQAALDYIARDLQQAVYIYDADGLTRDRNTTTIGSSGIRDQIPPVKSAPNCSVGTGTNPSVCTPVLVFWKREFVEGSVGVSSATDTVKNDGYTYSLVAYYLITNPNGSNTTWSPSARIGRFQIRGTVNAANANAVGNNSSAGYNPPPLSDTITGASLKEKMNQWQTALTASDNYTQRVDTLVDFISTSTNAPAATCSSGQRVGNDSSGNVSGFYGCVDATEILAQVYLRGNAFVRLYNKNNIPFTNSVSAYFPNVSVRAQGRGFIFTK